MVKTLNNRRFIAVFCFSFLILYLSASCIAEVVDKILAVVNDQTITASEFEEAMKSVPKDKASAKVRKEVLERLVEEKLILRSEEHTSELQSH